MFIQKLFFAELILIQKTNSPKAPKVRCLTACGNAAGKKCTEIRAATRRSKQVFNLKLNFGKFYHQLRRVAARIRYSLFPAALPQAVLRRTFGAKLFTFKFN